MTTQHEINLVGGRPWGFSLQGGSDHHSILRVGRVTPGSKAHNSGVNDGDVFLSINGQDCKGLKHVEAQQIIKSAGQTLALVVARGNVPIKPGTSTVIKPSPPPQAVPDGTPKPPTTPTTPPSPKPSLPPKPNVTHVSTSRSKPAPPSQKAQTQKPSPPTRSANQEEQQAALSRTRGGSNWYKQLMKTLHTQDDTTEVVIPMTGSRTPASELPRKPKPQNQEVPRQKQSQSPPQQRALPKQQPSQPPPQQQQPPPQQQQQPPQQQPSKPPSQQQQQQQRPPPQQQQPSQVPTKQPVVQSGSSGIRPTPPAVGSIRPTPPVSSSAGPPPSRTEKKHSPLQQEVEAEYKDAMDMKKMEESRLNELEEQIAADLKDLAESVREQVRSPMVLDPEPEPELVPYQPVIKQESEPEPYQLPVSLEPEPEPYQPPVSFEPEPEPEPYQPPVSLEPEPEPEPYQPPVSFEPEPESYQPSVPSGRHDTDNVVKPSNDLQQMHPLIAQEMMKEAQRETSPGRITGDFSSLEQLTAPGRHMPQDGAVQTHRQAEPDPQPVHKEKKHKPPPGESARALFDFTTDNARELPFKKDDIITLTRTVNDDWVEGELNGACGLIPLAYIEVLSSSEPTLPPPEEFGETVPSARGKFKFDPMSNRELEFDVGDIIRLTRVVNEDWLEGTLQDRKGIFPIAFVEIVHPLPGMTVPEEDGDSQQSTSEPADNTNDLTSLQTTEAEGSEQQIEGRGVSISELRESLAGMEGQRYQVIFEYEPTNADEVEILENDTVMVYVECDDGWFLGVNERTQKFGTFPGNYVQPLL